MDCENLIALLRRLQEMEFVAVELNLYLDTHPCDEEAINDYNCAVEALRQLKKEYESQYGPLLNFGMGGFSRTPWQWAMGPWPWEI
ncbi:MAG TPA: spore coat protein CotJB [Selenomonadales bacterium]|nr:spore coat protein CotJB [Selenomonadales bacterium]